MFDAGTGFFQFVFANLADEYFVAPNIKVDFPSLLRLRLIEDGFRYICFIDKTSFGKRYDYQMILTGGLNEKSLKEPKGGKGKPKIFGGNKSQTDTNGAGDYFAKSVVETDMGALCGHLRTLLRKMTKQRDFAIVCPIGIFSDCCDDNDLLKELVYRRKNPNHSIMILTGSTNAAEHDRFFRKLAILEAAYSNREYKSIFLNEDLFPEIKSYIRNCSSQKKLIFTYDYLKSVFRERMKLINCRDYRSLCSLVRYAVIRNRERLPVEYSSDYYAALIFAWYANDTFRKKYGDLDLPENLFLENSVIVRTVRDSAFFEAANAVLRSEGIKENNEKPREIAEYWGIDRKEVPIVYDTVTMTTRLPEIYSYLTAYRRNLKKHESILSAAEWKDLEEAERFFSRPCYPLYEGVLPHERCTQYQQKIQELYLLLKKDEWNSWDESAMRLLFLMYKRCRVHADKTDDEDVTNERGQLEIEKCFAAIERCIYSSEKMPDDRLQSEFLCSQTESVICRRDINALRAYKV